MKRGSYPRDWMMVMKLTSEQVVALVGAAKLFNKDFIIVGDATAQGWVPAVYSHDGSMRLILINEESLDRQLRGIFG